MTGQTRRIIYMAIAALLLIGVVVALKCMKRDTSEGETESSTGLAASEGVVSIRVENDGGGYTIYSADDEYEVEGAEDFELYSEQLENVLDLASSLEYTGLVIKDCENMAEYGLDNPYASMKTEYEDGSVLAFSIGTEIPNGGGERYMRLENDDDVYTVSSSYAEILELRYTDFISPVVVQGNEDAVVSDVRLSGNKRDEDIAIRPSGSAKYDFSIYEPLTAPTNQYTGDEAANIAVNGLTAVSVIAADPDDEQISSYGLDNPEYTAEYTSDGKTVKLKFSALQEITGMYACMEESGRLIYMVDRASAEWIDAPLSELVYEYIFEADISQVDKIECMVDGKTYLFQLTHDGDNVSAVCDGYGEIETASFEEFFDKLTDVKWTGETDGSVQSGEQELSFTIHYLSSSGRADDTISYSRMSELKFSISVNGKTYFYTEYSDVNEKKLALKELIG